MPESIVNLENLQVLNLEWNLFNGPLPDGFVNLKKLMVLNLAHNFFASKIPAKIGEMALLREIRLDSNTANNPFFGWKGPIPASIGLLKKLSVLDLHKNRLTGELPYEIGFLNDLEIFNVGQNEDLEGSVPEEYGQFTKLQEFYITETGIEGGIPETMCAAEPYIEITCADEGIKCSCCTCAD